VETLLGLVEQKSKHKGNKKSGGVIKSCYSCGKTGHLVQQCRSKKKKSGSEKVGAALSSIIKSKLTCRHCRIKGHNENDCWKKYLHKAPKRGEAAGVYLDGELLVPTL